MKFAGLQHVTKITKLSGGMTNSVYKIINKNDNFILRIFGNNTNMLIDRENEKNIINHLSKYNYAPKILEQFDNSRIEEYIDGCPNIDPCKYQKEICDSLRKIHDINYDFEILSFWDKFSKYKKLANNPFDEKINKLIDDIKKEKDHFLNEEVLGHGDLTLGNIILTQNNQIRFIDFEYSCIMPRCFDLANHICEYDNIKFDSPSSEIKKNIIKNYINDTIDYREDFLKILDKYILISHYYWGCWAIVQQNISELDCNYKEYADLRFYKFNQYF